MSHYRQDKLRHTTGSAYGGYTSNNTSNNYRQQRQPYSDNPPTQVSNQNDQYRSQQNRGYLNQSQRTSAGHRPTNTRHQHQLWMGDLDPTWNEALILAMWNACGEKPIAVNIIRDRINPQRGAYCFVSFADHEAAASALEKNGLPVPGTSRLFKVNWSSDSGRSSHGNYQNAQRNSDGAGQRQTDHSVFIGDIASDVTEESLFAAFKEHFPTEITLVKIMMDAATRQPKGFGFVRFSSVDAQHRALTVMNSTKVGSRNIRVGLAANSSSSGQGPLASNSEPLRERGSLSTVIPPITLVQPQPKLAPHTDPYNATIEAKGFTPQTLLSQVEALFLAYGDIRSVDFDSEAGIAIAEYLWRSSAEHAILFMHGFTYGDSHIRVQWGPNTAITGSKEYTGAKPYLSPIYGELVNPHIISKDESDVAFYNQSERCSARLVDERFMAQRMHRDQILEEF